MSLWIIGLFFFLMGSTACSAFYTVKLLIDIKYELKKGR